MAAKLKKRALAEYGGSHVTTEAAGEPSKRLKLTVQPQHSDPGESDSENALDLDLTKPESSILLQLIRFSTQIEAASVGSLQTSLRRIEENLPKVKENSIKQKLIIIWGLILSSGKVSEVSEKTEELASTVGKETSNKVVAAWVQAATQLTHKVALEAEARERLFTVGRRLLTSTANPLVHTTCLGLLSSLAKPEEPELSAGVSQLCGSYSMSQDARVRTAAIHGLLTIQNLGVKLDVSMYPMFCTALTDDYEGVRCEVLKLLAQLAAADPEHQLKVGDDAGCIRLIDDVFSRICEAINDVRESVRGLAATLIGSMAGVSQTYLEQTLDKKLMSNMRLKKTAHERQAGLVTSGEWSSGKTWADDAPKHELDAESVNLVALGSCGAFVHGLEDECFSVRAASVESLTKLSMENSSLACLALDFLVDMFNDEIEQVRLKAIASLTRIARFIQLQVHQLDVILGALDDYSTLLRERLHLMLQACKIATKDGLKSVINKLMVNLKKYPQDRRSILVTFKHLGANHPDLSLPLVTSLLDIHPFFDTPEPDIEDPSYLCTLVLVLNAAQHCPTLTPLLDNHTRRHHSYLQYTYPQLIPSTRHKLVTSTGPPNQTREFLFSVLKRVEAANRMSAASQMKVLTTSCRELERLASIETEVRDPASFSRMYIEAQMTYLKLVRDQGWLHANAANMPSPALRSNLDTLLRLSKKLTGMFSQLSPENLFLVRLLKLKCLGVSLVFVVCGSNQSARAQTEEFLSEFDRMCKSLSKEEISKEPFLSAFRSLNLSMAKPGLMASGIKPLLVKFPPQCLASVSLSTAQARAVIHEPTGGSETPLRCTAGLVLGIPMDCEVVNLPDPDTLRICIFTGDQTTHLSVPKRSDLVAAPGELAGSYRLLTTALFSHQVWSEALDVEVSLALDLTSSSSSSSAGGGRRGGESVVHLCDPVRVSVLPKSVRRGI